MSFSTFTTPAAQRPATVSAAVALLVVAAVGGLIASLFFIDEFGASFIAVAVVIAAIRIIAATGLLNQHRWAAILGAVITALDVALTVPMLFDGSSAGLQIVAVIALVIDAITLALLALPRSRRSYV